MSKLLQLFQDLESTPRQTFMFDWRENGQRPRPFIKWAGGKSHLLHVLRRCVPEKFGRYFEPFLGGGALFFSLCPQNALLSDSNEELIHCYKVVRDRPQDVIERLSKFTISEVEFYKIRALRTESLSDVARAARFIYLNKTCFNGLYRVNKGGLFNTPYGHSKFRSLVDPTNLRVVSNALRDVKVQCGDYTAVLESAVAGDFVYLDPPYLPIGKYSDFKRYTKKQFYESDHEQLAEVFRRLTKKGCFVLMSNSYHEKIAALFEDFYQATVSVPRYVNCKGEGRGKVNELLISNSPLPKIT